jgi:hypothetical protein
MNEREIEWKRKKRGEKGGEKREERERALEGVHSFYSLKICFYQSECTLQVLIYIGVVSTRGIGVGAATGSDAAFGFGAAI